MKRMTNKQAFDSLVMLARLSERGKLGFAIAKNRRKLETEIKEYMAKRDELIEQYGKPNGSGTYTLPGDRVPEFHKALAEYDNIEIEVAVMTVDLDVFCSGSLTSQDMYTLEWMIEDGGEKDEIS